MDSTTRLDITYACDTIIIPMAILTVKLPELLDQRLSATASRRGVSRSQLVREAIEQSLRVVSNEEQPSCLDLAGDLIGVHSGPRGLSHDKSYLKGYGK